MHLNAGRGAVQERCNDLCVSSYPHPRWKELITAEACIGSVAAAVTNGISEIPTDFKKRIISYLKCMYYGSNLFNAAVRLLF